MLKSVYRSRPDAVRNVWLWFHNCDCVGPNVGLLYTALTASAFWRISVFTICPCRHPRKGYIAERQYPIPRPQSTGIKWDNSLTLTARWPHDEERQTAAESIMDLCVVLSPADRNRVP